MSIGSLPQEQSDEFDTVLLAIGRTGEAEKLGLANAGATRHRFRGYTHLQKGSKTLNLLQLHVHAFR